MLEEGDAVALSGEDALKSLRETAKALKQDIVDFSNVREWGSGDPSVGSADIMKLLEMGKQQHEIGGVGGGRGVQPHSVGA